MSEFWQGYLVGMVNLILLALLARWLTYRRQEPTVEQELERLQQLEQLARKQVGLPTKPKKKLHSMWDDGDIPRK